MIKPMFDIGNNATNSWHQKAFALDAKYNSRRLKNNPALGILYIRRRNQLLRERRYENPDLQSRYMTLRSELLQRRYDDPSNISENPPINPEKPDSSLKFHSTNFAFAGVHHVFDHHGMAVSMLKFANNDPSKLCCASLDGSMSICEATSNPPKVIALVQGHSKGITAIDWSTSNDLIVSSSLDLTIRLWCLSSDSKLICLRVVADKLRAEVLCCSFAPSNNNLVVAGNSHGLLQVLNVSTGKYTRGGTAKIGGKIMSLACEESGGSLIWVGNDRGIISSFRLEPGTGQLSKLRRLERIGGFITSISWRSWVSKDFPFHSLLVSSACNSLFLYRINDDGTLVLWKKFPVKHRQYLVRSTFSPQMRSCLIASGSEDGSILLLDATKDGKSASVNALLGHASSTTALSFNYEETLLASGDHQGLVILWKNHQV